ncbi:MAG TPA: hypothetical protein V6C69_03525 [Trichormus sp.]|jgi:hypothetical protein
MTENDANKLYERASGRSNPTDALVIHVRIMGRSRDIALSTLDIGANSSDEVIRDSVARFMEVAPAQLRNTVIERHEGGNMTLRPEAVFG